MADIDRAAPGNYDFCDYCAEGIEGPFFLRPTGFEEGPPRLPVVRAWCGDCEPPDDIDQEALTYLAALHGVHSEEEGG